MTPTPEQVALHMELDLVRLPWLGWVRVAAGQDRQRTRGSWPRLDGAEGRDGAGLALCQARKIGRVSARRTLTADCAQTRDRLGSKTRTKVDPRSRGLPRSVALALSELN